jgi:hypothetical protein
MASILEHLLAGEANLGGNYAGWQIMFSTLLMKKRTQDNN